MNVRLRYNITFPAAAWFDGELIMTNYTLALQFVTQTMDPEDQNIALERVKYFLLNELHSTIFINQTDIDRAEVFTDIGLNVTTLPEEPVDQVVGIMLFYKLNAIMEGRLKITEIRFSSEAGDSIEYFHSENEHTDLFPATGWWHEPSLSHSDIELEDDDDIDTVDNNVVALNAEDEWKDQELGWAQAEVTQDLGQVVFANFTQNNNETKH
jgi:hypothetical protein